MQLQGNGLEAWGFRIVADEIGREVHKWYSSCLGTMLYMKLVVWGHPVVFVARCKMLGARCKMQEPNQHSLRM